jgi:hypothetical protein
MIGRKPVTGSDCLVKQEEKKATEGELVHRSRGRRYLERREINLKPKETTLAQVPGSQPRRIQCRMGIAEIRTQIEQRHELSAIPVVVVDMR